jgi:hypothetical protein
MIIGSCKFTPKNYLVIVYLIYLIALLQLTLEIDEYGKYLLPHFVTELSDAFFVH